MLTSLHGFALFCLVYVLATASPGPGIAAIVARALSHGTQGIAAFIAGFVVGDLIWFALAASGMAVLAQTAHTLFLVLKYAGAAYLLYLAFRLWTAPAAPISEVGSGGDQRSSKLFVAGVALTLGNPKVMVFFLALLPTVITLTQITLAGFLQVAAAICVILSCVLTFYAIAAMRTRRFFKSAKAVRWLNRGSGTVMAGAAVAVAAR
jgi:threonine/homoserine/homoserine lactone efflux protein